MISLLVSAALVTLPPSDALCAAAYAVETQHMQESGELPSAFAPLDSLTPPQKTAVAASRRMITQGVLWTAMATRTDEGRRETNRLFRALARSKADANVAFGACNEIRVEDRMPQIATPPAPDGDEGCASEVAAFFNALRACASLQALRGQAQDSQSKLERGALSCRSKEQARAAWGQIGSALAGADSQGQRFRCGAQ